MAGTCQESHQTFSFTAFEDIKAKRFTTTAGAYATGAANEQVLGVSDTDVSKGRPGLAISAGRMVVQFASIAGDLSKLQITAEGKVIAATSGTVVASLDPRCSSPSKDDDYATVILNLTTA